MKRVAVLVVSIMLGLWVAPVLGAEYVAMVMDVEGRSVQFADGKPVPVMAFLAENDEVRVEDSSKVVIIFFESSIREAISGPTTIRIGVNGSFNSAGRSAKIRRETVDYLPPKAKLDKSLHQNFGNIAFRGLEQADEVGSPLVIRSVVNSAYVPDARPILTWELYPGADVFYLKVCGQGVEDVFTTKSSFVQMSKGRQEPGRYTWVLMAKKDGLTVARREGWYSIMTPEAFEAMAKQREMILSDYPTGSVEGMASLALLYQSYEMWNEVALILQALHDKQPDNGEIVYRLRVMNPYLLEKTASSTK